MKLNIDVDLHLKKTLQLRNKIVVSRSVSHEGNKFYPQFFLDDFWNKL